MCTVIPLRVETYFKLGSVMADPKAKNGISTWMNGMKQWVNLYKCVPTYIPNMAAVPYDVTENRNIRNVNTFL